MLEHILEHDRASALATPASRLLAAGTERVYVCSYMSYRLNPLKGINIGDNIGDYQKGHSGGY